MSITLKQFNGASVTPKDDAILYNHLVGQSGIISGCAVTHLGANQLQVAAGYGIICGRVFVIAQETIYATVSTSGTKYGRLLIEVDIENTSTPISFVTQAEASLPALTQEDINDDGTVYQIALNTYNIDTTTISSLVDVSTQVEPRYDHVIGARFTKSTMQTIDASTATAIIWDTYSYNPDSSQDAGNTTHMVCKYKGNYTIHARGEFLFGAEGKNIYMLLKKNGATIENAYGSIETGLPTTTLQITLDLCDLEVDDYLEVFVGHDDTTSKNFSSPTLSMRRNSI